jgi:hypothetical protein
MVFYCNSFLLTLAFFAFWCGVFAGVFPNAPLRSCRPPQLALPLCLPSLATARAPRRACLVHTPCQTITSDTTDPPLRRQKHVTNWMYQGVGIVPTIILMVGSVLLAVHSALRVLPQFALIEPVGLHSPEAVLRRALKEGGLQPEEAAALAESLGWVVFV